MARIVVPGSITEPYKKRQGDFSPDLVGLQFTEGASLFTLGNFAITTNVTPSLAVDFNAGNFSEAYCLENLNITQSESNVLSNNSLTIVLNLDPGNLERFVYFGSFTEYLRVNLEEILTSWKGSLYVTDLINNYGYTQIKNTVLTYSYDSYTDQSKFLIPTSLAINTFGLDYESNVDTPSFGDISNLSYSYKDYQISNDYGDFKVLGFTGTSSNNTYINVTVSGNPFPTLTATTFGSFKYHLRPNDEILEKFFFSQLDDFKSIILDRLVKPKYSITIQSPTRTETGIIFSTKKLTWPTTDGYNLDNEGGPYATYIDSFYKIVLNYDNTKTDLMTRRFVSESILEFDTDGGGTEIYGIKVTKLLRIYGREFDEVKKYIDGISFANHVTYNKKDNISDELVKSFSTVLGFDTILSFNDNNLLKNSLATNVETFSGYTRSLSIAEMDIELWRRLVINAWWLYKSKGHRKVIEFYLNLFGIDECLIDFDECIYIARDKLDYAKTVQEIANYIDPISGDTSLVDTSTLPMDVHGFPRVLPNTPDYYFQMNGFWWNGGNLTNKGNNPHLGPYDYGKEYFDRFRCMIDGFDGASSATTTFTTLTNYFTDYSNGTIENGMLPYGTTFGNVMELTNRISNNAHVIGAGASNNITRNGKSSFRITFNIESNLCIFCPTELLEYENGIIFHDITSDEIGVFFNNNQIEELLAAATFSEECCDKIGGYYLPLNPTTTPGPCPDPSELILDSNGTILGIESAECCNKDTGIAGAYWDGTKCKINLVDVPTGDPNSTLKLAGGNTTSNESTVEIVPSQSLFETISIPRNGGINVPPDVFVCWWCPPLERVCDSTEFVNTLNPQQLTTILNNLGLPPTLTLLNIQALIKYFDSLGASCVLMINGDAMIDDKCCRLRGGSTIDDGYGNKLCVILDDNPCPNIDLYKQNYISYNSGQAIEVTDENGNPLSSECCTVYQAQVDPNFSYESFSSSNKERVGCVKPLNDSVCMYTLPELHTTVLDDSCNWNTTNLGDSWTLILKELKVNNVDLIGNLPTQSLTVFPSTINVNTSCQYTNFVDWLNQLFSTLGMVGYKAKLSNINFGSTTLPVPFANNTSGFYIIRPGGDTFSMAVQSNTQYFDNYLYYSDIGGGRYNNTAPTPALIRSRSRPSECGYSVSTDINGNTTFTSPDGVIDNTGGGIIIEDPGGGSSSPL